MNKKNITHLQVRRLYTPPLGHLALAKMKPSRNKSLHQI